MKKILFIILIGVLIMLKPINSIIKDSLGNILFRGNVVTGIVDTDNGNGSYDVFISQSEEAYPNIFTLATNPDIAVGDKVRILYKNGCKELPIILPPTITGLQLFENQQTTSVAWATINRPYIQKGEHFIAESNHTIEKIALYLLKYNGSVTGTAYIDIYNADGNGFPTGAILSTIDFDTSLLPDKATGLDWDWTEYMLDTPINIVSGSEIVIVVRFPDGLYSNAIYWGLYVPNDASGRGIESDDTGATWIKDIGGYYNGNPIYTDFTFKIYGR